MLDPGATVAALRDLRNALDGLRSEHLRRRRADPRDDLIERTRSLAREAVALNVPQFAAVAALRRAEIELERERWIEALDSLAQARTHVQSLPDHEHGSFLRRMEAQAFAALDRWEDVRRVCREGIALVEPSRARVSPLTLQNSYLRFRIGLYELAARAEIELGHWDGALEVAELVKCRSLSRLAVVDGIDDEAALLADYRTVCHQIDEVVARGGNPETLLARRRSLWDLAQISRLSGREPPGPATLGRVRGVLAPDEAVLYYFWVDPGRLLVAALSAERAACTCLIVPSFERVRLDENAAALQSPRPPHSAAELPSGMTDLLVPADLRAVLQDKQRLFISPHRVLHALPLHALPWGEGYLAESFAVTYIANLGALLRPTPAAVPADVLAVGVSQSQAPPADRFKRLSAAADEVRDLQALYGTRCQSLLDDAATESALARWNESGELRRFGVLHFACHGLNVDSENPMESKLFLRDSALDGLDVAAWRLEARLVVLSACCTGQRPVSSRSLAELPGDDLFGLQAAFYAAGAQQIVSTLWPVDSSAARTVMLAFHARLKDGLAAELALQGALLDFLQTARARGSLKEQRPYTWAPFFLTACSRL